MRLSSWWRWGPPSTAPRTWTPSGPCAPSLDRHPRTSPGEVGSSMRASSWSAAVKSGAPSTRIRCLPGAERHRPRSERIAVGCAGEGYNDRGAEYRPTVAFAVARDAAGRPRAGHPGTLPAGMAGEHAAGAGTGAHPLLRAAPVRLARADRASRPDDVAARPAARSPRGRDARGHGRGPRARLLPPGLRPVAARALLRVGHARRGADLRPEPGVVPALGVPRLRGDPAQLRRAPRRGPGG